ncbi:MAG: hypothetical protein JNM39_08650 [Bdellovibrionaceae bacterium]|nr:hypothetical protein [Pseudobdellovibrionaceae bacterium]
MKMLTMILVTMVFQLTHAAPLGQLTYGEAASTLTLERLEAAYVAMNAVTETTLPHETKDTRKQILAAREMLDLFAYSFESGKDYARIRNKLDEGYEAIGHFKDLFDSQGIEEPEQAKYDQKQVRIHRHEVLAWKQNFFELKKDFVNFVTNVRTAGASEHKKKDLSTQFWGVSDTKPKTQDLAQVAIGLLLEDLWKKSVEEYKVVKGIENPGKDLVNIDMYHDFRKRVRTAVKIINYFDETKALVSEQQLTALNEMVGQYGTISDLIARAELLTLDGKENKAKAVYKQIKTQWDKVQKWEKEQDLKEVLKSMVDIDFTSQNNQE